MQRRSRALPALSLMLCLLSVARAFLVPPPHIVALRATREWVDSRGRRPNPSASRHRGRLLCSAASAEGIEVKRAALPTGVDMEYCVAHPPAQGSSKPPLVFIHGSFHGAWCWVEAWMPFFAAAGFSCYAMSLRGTSSTPQLGDAKTVQLAEHVDDLTAFLESVVPAAPGPPVLIGHSFGGMYAQKVCEQQRLNIGALVLLCSVSPRGSTSTVLRYLFQKPKLAWEIVRAFVFKEAATDIDISRRVFFSDTTPSDAKVREYMRHFAADSVVGLDTRTAPQQFPAKTGAGADGRANRAWLDALPPTLVVGARRDLVVDGAAVEETADFYESELLWVDGPHDCMLDPAAQGPSAQAVLAWLERHVCHT